MKTLLLMAKKGLIINFIVSPLMSIAFLVLKFTKVVTWSWWFVCGPLLGIPCGFVGLIFLKMIIKIKKGEDK